MSENTLELNSIVLAASSVFGDGVNSFTTNEGKVVKITPCKMKHLEIITGFFTALVNRIDAKQLGAVIDFVATRQKNALAAGLNPLDFNLQDMLAEQMEAATAEEMSGAEAIAKMTTNANLLITLVNAVLGELPKVLPAFTNLTMDEWGELTPDEAAITVGGIFMVNYRFFTQSLRPVLMAFALNLVRKQAEAKGNKPAGTKPAAKLKSEASS